MLSVIAIAPGAEPIDSAYKYLLTQGILGVVCLLLILALVWVSKNLLQSKDDRIADQKKYAEALHGINDAVKELTIEMHKASGDTASSVLVSNEATRIAVGTLEKTNDRVASALGELKNEQVRLGASVESLRNDQFRGGIRGGR